MEQNEKSKKNSFKSFVKKYSYYLVLATLIVLLAIMVTVATITKPEENAPVNSEVVAFISPVANANITKGFSATELQYNATLNQWETHKALDFSAETGANVMAVYGGTVTEIYTNLLEGTTIKINHGNDLQTVYSSLSDEVNVKVGDVVTQGAIIGTASASASNESSDGSHIHFEVWKDGTKVDPSGYLTIEEK